MDCNAALFVALALSIGGCPVKTTVVTPLGRITAPNKFGQFPPGALLTAQNVVVRDRGVLSSIPALSTMNASVTGTNETAKGSWPGTDYQLVWIYNTNTLAWSLKWVTSSGGTLSSAVTFPSGVTPTFLTTMFSASVAAPPVVARQRGRILIGSDQGILALDSEADSSARLAGLGRPFIYGGIFTLTAGTMIADGYQVGYIATIRRVHSDAYETNGPFSGRYLLGNDDGLTQDITIRVSIESNTAVAAGDIVELYRTRATLLTVDVGDTYYLAKSQVVTSTDVSNEYIDIFDNILEADLGVEAYVNPGQLTRNKDKTPPPAARDILVHDGHTFYFGTTTPAVLNEYLAGMMVGLSNTPLTGGPRKTGIGIRSFTATQTAGSAVLSAISGADIVGLAVGQLISGGNCSGFYITAVGATSVTLDNVNPGGTSAGLTFTATDQMSIGGVRRTQQNFFLWSTAIGRPSSGDAYAFVAADQVADEVSTSTVSGFSFAIGRQFPYEGSFTIQASNGANYNPPIATYSDTAQTVAADQKLNRVHWSESQQPEAVPLLNTFFVGSGEIYRAVSVGGVILVFASDGLWQVRGDASGWSVQSLDPTLILSAKGAVDTMDGVAWAYTNRGLVSVSPDGEVTEISAPLVGPATSTVTQVVCDQRHHEVVSYAAGSSEIYNVRTGAFTTLVPGQTTTFYSYSAALAALVLYGHVGASVANVEYFPSIDTSGSRLANAIVRFQPIYVDDPSTMKEWDSVEYVFEGLDSNDGALVPTFGGVAFNARDFTLSAGERRVMVGVARNAPAYAPTLMPGFSFSSGGTTNAWSLRAMAIRYMSVIEEGKPR